MVDTVFVLGIGAAVFLSAVFGVVDAISHDETSPLLWKICATSALGLMIVRSIYQRL